LTGIPNSEEVHQWEDIYHMSEEDFDAGEEYRRGWTANLAELGDNLNTLLNNEILEEAEEDKVTV
jgi:hypothetical protein